MILSRYDGSKEHGRILTKNLYKKYIKNIETIDDLPIAIRKRLIKDYITGGYSHQKRVDAGDGTIKYLFNNETGLKFESVFMPGTKRNTLCISTQAGCKMGCKFCMTGKLGFIGNLTKTDIINQLYSLPERALVNRIVFMGMGEPLDNLDEVKKSVNILTANWGFAFGKANITLSSAGLIASVEKFLAEPFCNLAISLNSPFPEERKLMMPIEQTNPIHKVVKLIRLNPLPKPLRVSFEYVGIGQTNLTEEHAVAVGVLLKGIKCHVNIIPLNNQSDSQYSIPNPIEIKKFIGHLNKNEVLASLRMSRGQDVGGACGQLAYNSYSC